MIKANSENLLEKACKLSEATDLHYAASIDDVKSINSILESGLIDINCRDKHGQTPLHYAALRSCEGAVETLLSRGSRIGFINNHGDKAYDLATKNRNEKIIKMIDRRKSHLNSDFLVAAILDPDFKEAKTFLKEGADINTKDANGNTALHFVAASGKVPSVINLLQEGAKYNAKNNDRDTPLHCAVRNNKTLVVEALLGKTTAFWDNIEIDLELNLHDKESINAKNKFKKTPLDLAIKNNNYEIIKIFSEVLDLQPGSLLKKPSAEKLNGKTESCCIIT